MKLLVIDGDNNMHRAYHKFKRFKDKDGNGTGMIYGLPYIIGNLMRMFRPDNVIVVFDYGRHERRIQLLPDYKKRDKSDRDDFEKQRLITEELIQNLGLGYVRKKGHEADDIIYWVCRQFKKEADRIIIVSNDKDFDQLIDNKVMVWSPHTNEMYTQRNKRGLLPKQSLDFLILSGDKSDNIPGIRGVGEETAISFLKEFGSIKNYLKQKQPKPFKAITKEKILEVYKRNKELIGIKTFFRRNLINVEYDLIQNEYNQKYIDKIIKKHNLKSFNSLNFTNPFKNLRNGN